MRELIEQFLKELFNTVQIARLYNIEHPTFRKALEGAGARLQEYLRLNAEMVIGIVGEELTYENEIFFDLSKVLKPSIALVREKGVERIVFARGVNDDELARFVDFIAARGLTAEKAPEALARAGLQHITAGKLSVSQHGGHMSGKTNGDGDGDSMGGGSGKMKPAQSYQLALDTATQSVMDIVDTEAVDHLALKFALSSVLEQLTTSHQDFLKLVTIRRYDQITYVHLLNVAVLSMFVASRAGFSREDTLDIGTAGLFHDIGKMYISRKILRKTDKLTDEEFAKIRNHAAFGAQILLQHVDSMGMLPAVVAFEHHIKHDLTGYPRSPYIKQQFTASGIVSICDVYDALNQRRSYKSDYPPDMVYKFMIKDRGTAFDAALFDTFYRVMGAWPIGATLELSDGSLAVVRDENEDDIFSPVVEILRPAERRARIDLRTTKDTLTIARFVNPWKEGKDLLASI